MQIICDIESCSHDIDENAFKFFQSTKAEQLVKLDFQITSARRFSMAVDGDDLSAIGSEHIYHHAHLLVSSFLVALNIVSLGFFYWVHEPTLHPIYRIVGHDNPDSNSAVMMGSPRSGVFDQIRKLEESDVRNAIIP